MRAAMHAPGLVFLVLVIATCGTLLYAGTVPGYLFDPQVFGIAGAVVLAGIAILRFVLACGVGFACGRLREVLRQRGWWACVAVAAATALMVALDVPGRVGFAWHRGELEAIVAGWDRDSGLPAANHAGQRFTIDRGLFDEVPIEPWTLVARNAADGDAPDGASPEWRGLIVIAQGTGFIANRGFYLYLPAMSADTARDFGLRHLEGPWYSFVRTG